MTSLVGQAVQAGVLEIALCALVHVQAPYAVATVYQDIGVLASKMEQAIVAFLTA